MIDKYKIERYTVKYTDTQMHVSEMKLAVSTMLRHDRMTNI